MNLISEKKTLEAITILSNQIATLQKEVAVLGDLTDAIPFIMSLVRDAESKLQSLHDAKEKKVRDICWQLGLSNSVDLAMLQQQNPLALRPPPISQAPVVIPSDLVEEIVSRIPATYLSRLRSTCRRWNALFKHDWRFAKKHSDKAAKEFMMLMLTKEYTIRPLSVNLDGFVPSVEVKRVLSLPDPHYNYSCQFEIQKVVHCDGLLLCTNEEHSRLVVWNPVTGQTKWIKASKHFSNVRGFALGYCQDNKYCDKSYKILSYCYGGGSGKDIEIYDFSSDSWRIIDHDIAPGWSVGCSSYTFSFKGKTIWFARDITNTYPGRSLHMFDYSTEKSSLLATLPRQYDRYETCGLSVVREEKFSMLLKHEDRTKTEIWVTNKIDDSKAVSWSKVLALDLASCNVSLPCDASFILDEEKKVIVCSSRWVDPEDDEDKDNAMNIIYVIGEDHQVTQVGFDINSWAACWPAILSYVPSLAQINGAGGKRKRA